MADDSEQKEPRAHPDPDGSPPLPDSDRVHGEPQLPPGPLTSRQKLTAVLVMVMVIIVVGVVIGQLR
ncbi:hypothetical protein [Salinispora cortesiana]|uniref:hypothetical protein n=1 Tax=Salinispora cortesiana TaxID=1305843 RepID=UPI0004700436|nr:hypothetical protein [Salinispora cortesiana]